MDNQNHRVDVSHSKPSKPMPWLRVYTLGSFQIEWVTSEVDQAQPLPDERLSRRGAGPSLALFKALLCCPDRFATRDWLLEQFWPDSSARSAGDRLDDVASALRGLLRPTGSQEKVLHFVYGADGRGSGYRLNSYPHLWCDADALTWNIQQAARMERFGDDPLPFWQRAYTLASRGPSLAEHCYEDWAKAKREETHGHLRQTVHSLARLYRERFGRAGEEESLLVLRTYWQAYPTDEDALRQLMELLSKHERFQEALEYYASLETILAEEGSELDTRTQDLAEYIRTKQTTRVRTTSSAHMLDILCFKERSLLPPSTTLLEGIETFPALSDSSPRSPSPDGLSALPMISQSANAGSTLVLGVPRYWNVPYLRNPFFTGRDEVLTRLYDLFSLRQASAAVTQHALSGLGGIGKTQIALEYTYRYSCEYHAIFWVKADTRDNLLTDFLALATLLHLPEGTAQDHRITIAAIHQWMRTHAQWLLILDNVEDLSLVREILPAGHQGHFLLTTRLQALGGVAHYINVDVMDQEIGTLFLLRRARVVAPDALPSSVPFTEHQSAKQLVQELGGLPLALDQAAAYVEATGMTLEGYRHVYQHHRIELLQERRELEYTHPESVATTWSLSLQKVAERNAAAIDLLQLCAFLAPDAISENLLRQGGYTADLRLSSVVNDLYLWENTIEALRAYSLVKRDAHAKTLTVHRLVQSVIRDTLPQETQLEWMQHAVCLLEEAFPFAIEVALWSECERLLSHALLCTHWIEQAHLCSPQVASLLDKIGYYLNMRARYEEAKPLFHHAAAIREDLLGSDHPDTAQTLSNLAYLYHHQDKYEQATSFLQRSLDIRQRVLGKDHPDTATSLNAFGLLYHDQGKYQEAESFYHQALTIRERVLGADHPDTAHSLCNLAWLYRNQGKYLEARTLYKRSLAIREQILGSDHPHTATCLNGLALLYTAQGKPAEAEQLYQQALTIRRQVLGPKHLHTAQTIHALAQLYRAQSEYSKAESLFQEALIIREHVLGQEHPRTVASRNALALFYREQGNFEKAEWLFQQIQGTYEHLLGWEHPQIVENVTNLVFGQRQMSTTQPYFPTNG